jgi:hypothetical protein
MAPFTNEVKFNTSQLMFFLVDNMAGNISEYSESCKSILRFKNRYQQEDDLAQRIHDFIVDFDFLSFKNGRKER